MKSLVTMTVDAFDELNDALTEVAVGGVSSDALERVLGVLARAYRSEETTVIHFPRSSASPAERQVEARCLLRGSFHHTTLSVSAAYHQALAVALTANDARTSGALATTLVVELLQRLGHSQLAAEWQVYVPFVVRGDLTGLLVVSTQDAVASDRLLRMASPVLSLALRTLVEGASIEPDEMLQVVMDNIPQHIFWKNFNSVYLGCNKNFARVAGVKDPADIVGKTDYDLAWKREEAEFFRVCDRRIMDNDAPEYHIIEPQLQADGKRAWLDTTKAPLHNAKHEVVGMVGTFEDITSRVQLEDQLRLAQKMEAVGQLAGGVAHDFKNLMMIVSGQAELALRDGPTARITERLQAIMQAGQRTAGLADKLLTFARQRAVPPEVIDANRAIAGMGDVLRQAVPENIELVTALGDAPALVLVDPTQFEQIVLNLVFNAKDAMQNGGQLSVSTEIVQRHLPRQLAAGSYLLFEVKDTGTGMSHQVAERVFEPFFSTKEAGRGTGLGLSMVYGSVQQAKGCVTLDSVVGIGTTFRVYLPIAKASRPSTGAVSPVPGRTAAKEIVLVVEDETQVRLVTMSMVESLGHSVLHATNGDHALKVLMEHPEVTLVVTDFIMPVLGGREFLDQLRSRYPSLAVVCISGYTGASDELDQALASGARFLAKPYNLAQLSLAMQNARVAV